MEKQNLIADLSVQRCQYVWELRKKDELLSVIEDDWASVKLHISMWHSKKLISIDLPSVKETQLVRRPLELPRVRRRAGGPCHPSVRARLLQAVRAGAGTGTDRFHLVMNMFVGCL